MFGRELAYFSASPTDRTTYPCTIPAICVLCLLQKHHPKLWKGRSGNRFRCLLPPGIYIFGTAVEAGLTSLARCNTDVPKKDQLGKTVPTNTFPISPCVPIGTAAWGRGKKEREGKRRRYLHRFWPPDLLLASFLCHREQGILFFLFIERVSFEGSAVN